MLAGDQLGSGAADPRDLLRALGASRVGVLLLDELQAIFATQHLGLDSRHLEVILRQLLDRVQVIDSGDTPFRLGELIERHRFGSENDRLRVLGRRPARATASIAGLTRIARERAGFLTAAQRGDPQRSITAAALAGLIDRVEVG